MAGGAKNCTHWIMIVRKENNNFDARLLEAKDCLEYTINDSYICLLIKEQ